MKDWIAFATIVEINKDYNNVIIIAEWDRIKIATILMIWITYFFVIKNFNIQYANRSNNDV